MSREVASGSTAQTCRPCRAAAATPARELPGAVLFACTMNAVRSVMAAAILRHLAGKRAYVASAGVRAGDARSVRHGRSWTRSASTFRSTRPNTLRDLHDTSFDLIVTLSPEAHHQALELTRTMAVDVEYWPTHRRDRDGGAGQREQTLAHYRDVRDQLFERIKTRFGFEGGPTV